ncbi:unnamed protein product [Rotaria sp. Silwood1]|nr:unnamed protein product [Rotaria sp. Silwood1]
MPQASNEQPMPTAEPNILKRLYAFFLPENLYKTDVSLSSNEKLVATRLYLGLLAVSIVILFVLTASSSQTRSITVDSPSISQFDFLSARYPLTLSCLCSQVTIPYNTFLSFAPEYHQVCSSKFISESWISSMFSINTTNYSPLDFRTSASSQFETLALLCTMVSEFVSSAVQVFTNQQLISSRTLSRSAFDAQLMSLVQQLQTTTVIDITSMDQFVSLSIDNNQLVSALHTNYFIYSVPGSRLYITYSGVYIPIHYSLPLDPTTFCGCASTYKCIYPSGFFNNWTLEYPFYYFIPDPPPVFSVPGFFAGCIPRYSISQSTMECFYNSTCLNQIQALMGDTSSRRPLNDTIQSHFKPNATIESMFAELFIEGWHDTRNFTAYFNTCNPKSCSYTYEKRFYVIYVFVTLFGLIGGLTVVLHLFAKFFVQHFIRRVRSMNCCQPVTRQEVLAVNSEKLSECT